MTAASHSRQMSEVAVPGTLVGGVAGVFAGLLGLLAGEPPGWASITAVTLSLPLAAFGAGYSLTLARRLFPPGRFAPAAAYWFVGFPVARLLHESAQRLLFTGRVSIPGGTAAFLVFQALLSVGFAIGFVWTHERIMPRWLLRIHDHNPSAERLLADYLVLAEHAQSKHRRGRTP